MCNLALAIGLLTLMLGIELSMEDVCLLMVRIFESGSSANDLVPRDGPNPLKPVHADVASQWIINGLPFVAARILSHGRNKMCGYYKVTLNGVVKT